MLTYQQAYDKIIQAYFNDEIQPYNSDFCFCGTLADGADNWCRWSDVTKSQYTAKQYSLMEIGLLGTISNIMGEHIPEMRDNVFANSTDKTDYGSLRKQLEAHEKFEDALFQGMCAALEVLKQIHKERGEDVDNISTPFTQRKKEQLCQQ